jgi:fructose/tagatose bisphosphate aldolase
MPLVSSKEILVEARKKRYGVPSLLVGDLEMVTGSIMAAEERKSPLSFFPSTRR